ncbi:hypothetical protein ACFWJM_29335 [Streptomyces sp. NPDC127077]|uniref:hypothetical protein n=1 Tax=Streptomyces sp. NPDC127077 TaxID=3347131 RepID=UPI003666A3EA
MIEGCVRGLAAATGSPIAAEALVDGGFTGLSSLRRGSGDYSTAATSVANLIDNRFNAVDVAGTLQTAELLMRAGQDPAGRQRQAGDRR